MSLNMSETIMNRRKRPLTQIENASTSSISIKRGRTKDDSIDEVNRGFKPRAGTIVRIILKNFMCHSLFEIHFTNNATIIIGQNGSGKSAILTAVIVGLGGKASLTNRGTSVKGFVKAGKTSGSVEIELFNEGVLAYRPETYGRRIKISRNFSANGSSQYKIKDEFGKIVATQAKEVKNITIAFNIQVDNPVCILNQDISRNFLNSNDPKHKFTLFMKGTRLEKLKEEYEKITNYRNECLEIFSDKQNDFENLQKAVKKLKIKIDNHRNIVEIQDEIKLNQIELLWATTRDLEEEINEEEKKMETLKKQQENIQNNCENRLKKIEKYKTDAQELKQQIEELKNSIDRQMRPQQELTNTIEELRHKLNDKKMAKQVNEVSIKSMGSNIEDLKNQIANIESNMSRAEKERMERNKTLQIKETRLKQVEEQLQTARNDLYQFQGDSTMKDEQKDNFEHELRSLSHQIREKTSSIESLKKDSGNSLLLYGNDVPRVKQLIEQNKDKFRHMPRGPLGSYVKLKDKKWDVAVESFLGVGLLMCFVVDNRDDNRILTKIFDQAFTRGRQPMIITTKFFNKVHDVRPNLVRSLNDCSSLFDVLQIDDPVVANCLIDEAQIENVLLFPNNQRAMELMSDSQNVPRNCRQGVTIKGDRYYPDPDFKTYGSMYHRAKFLQVDTKQYIFQLEQDIKKLIDQREIVQQHLKEINNEIREQGSRKSKLEQKIRQLMAEKSQLSREIDELNSSRHINVVSAQYLEKELAQANETYNEKIAANEAIDVEIKEIKEKILDCEEKLNQFKKSNQSLNERLMELAVNLKEKSHKLKEIQLSDGNYKKQLLECEEKIKEVEEILNRKKISYKKKFDEASKVGERPEKIRMVTEIVAQIQLNERAVRRIRAENENIEEIIEKYKQLEKKQKEVTHIMTTLKITLDDYNNGFQLRSRNYKLTEKYFITYIKQSFKKMMEIRDFKGFIEINPNESKLELLVMPKQGAQGTGKTTNLSGGEKSFSTVAFLYSLWQCTDFPFYFLDEFDVFMDKLNRTKVIEILLHHANTHPSLQFVLMTPQDLSFIGDNVTILRMADPERRALSQ